MPHTLASSNIAKSLWIAFFFIFYAHLALSLPPKDQELGVSSSYFITQRKFEKFSLGFNYDSYINYRIERNQVESHVFDQKKFTGTHLKLEMTEQISKDTGLKAFLGIGSLEKNIFQGGMALHHEINSNLRIESQFSSTPLYTEMPLPQSEIHANKIELKFFAEIYRILRWNSIITRKSEFVIEESHNLTGIMETRFFRQLRFEPIWNLAYNQSSKPNPFQFVPQKMYSITLGIPLYFDTNFLWNFEIKPHLTYGAYKRHSLQETGSLSSFGIKSIIYTKKICTVCINVTLSYSGNNLSDSPDFNEHQYEFILNFFAKS